MSLLTLQSSNNAQNPSATDPAIIRNNFKDGVELRKGTEVGLVSLSINKINSFEIIQGVNDTFTWRIGNISSFNQHKVIVPAGEYTGITLAEQIKIQLDNSTILGNFKGAWTVSFDDTKFEGDGSFTIDYGQNATPDFNENTLELYAGSPNLVISNNSSSQVDITGGQNANDIVTRKNGLNIITGEKGIFPNDGEVAYEIIPIKGYPLESFTNTLTTGIYTENNSGVTRGVSFNLPAGGSPAETNGWDLVADFDNADPDEYWYYDPSDEGHIGIGTDASLDASLPTSWVREVYYNDNVEFLQDTTAGGRYSTTAINVGLKYSGDPEGTKLGIQKQSIGYGNTKLGWVRNQLYQGKNDYPGNPDAEIKSTQNDGFDMMFEIQDNVDFDGIIVNLSQMLKTQGIAFPNTGWRGASKMVFQNVTPASWNTIPGTNPAPTPWTGFNYGEDNIQVKFQFVGITNLKILILHDTQGDGNFTEQTMLIQLSQAGNNVTKNIIEEFFPVRPCMTMVNGGRYEQKVVKVSGRFDETEISQAVDFTYKSGEADYEDVDIDDELGADADPPSNAVKLSALFLFGEIFDSDLTPTGTLPPAEVPTPASKIINNISSLIGFERFEIYPSGQVSNPTSSIQKPIITIREPNLLVELVDFNIKGYNGATGDRGKIISSIPAEELNTNTRTGTLNYFSQYPIMIDLNLVNDIIVYDLNVIIRRPNGQIADDLIGKTAITLLFKEGEESKQRRMLREQAELISSSMSNINQIKTDSVGMGFPKM
jgi:hypothetical protein